MATPLERQSLTLDQALVERLRREAKQRRVSM